jgi:hypothetical protein
MELVRSHLSTASRSNDLDSPSIPTDFDEDLFGYDLAGNAYIEVSCEFNNLINSIRHIK